jgi:molybdenum cofactor biosynthesis enzyme MoaA
MPEEGIELSPKSNILSDDEVIRLATLFVQSGVTKIRLTGGEPTIRKGIIDLVGAQCCLFYSQRVLSEVAGRLNDLRQYGLKSIGITSNGLVLHRQLPRLIQNGLTHVNIRSAPCHIAPWFSLIHYNPASIRWIHSSSN